MNTEASASRRPGRQKSAEKAEAIREAAAELFMTEGMMRTSMDAIAAAAGVSKQTVYSHFRSKDDLFRACVAAKVKTYGLDGTPPAAGADIGAVLRHLGRQYLTLLCDEGVICMFRLMVAEVSAHPQVAGSFHEAGPTATLHVVRDAIEPHLSTDGDARDLALQAASEFLALIRGRYFLSLLLGTRTGIDEAELHAHVDHCIAQTLRLYPLT
ncbi:MAG: TetR/AcrR family transcriptional regulator [Pseudomonadota bacterium]